MSFTHFGVAPVVPEDAGKQDHVTTAIAKALKFRLDLAEDMRIGSKPNLAEPGVVEDLLAVAVLSEHSGDAELSGASLIQMIEHLEARATDFPFEAPLVARFVASLRATADEATRSADALQKLLDEGYFPPADAEDEAQ